MSDCPSPSSSYLVTVGSVGGSSSVGSSGIGSPVSVSAMPLSLDDTVDTTCSTCSTVSPPWKRQKKQDSSSDSIVAVSPKRLSFGPPLLQRQHQHQDSLLLQYLVDPALTAHIFSFVGPVGTAKCAATCRSWRIIVSSTQSLWKQFVKDDFGLSLSSSNNNHTTKVMIHPWEHVYRHIRLQQQHPNHRLNGRVLFADDGGNFPGYPPNHALLPETNRVWCTRPGVDANVDLVIQLASTCLVTGFVCANGGRGYSAPLQEALVFLSLEQPPNLQAARFYNTGTTQQNVGPQWVRYLFQKEEEPANNTTNNTPPPPPLEDNNNNDNNNDNHHPEPTSPASTATTNKPPSNNDNNNDPVASFWFPHLQQAYYGRSQQTLAKPIVARYIHLKLLSSHSPPGLEDISDNIDLMHFHTLGVPLPLLDTTLLPNVLQSEAPPNYVRTHERRHDTNTLVPHDPRPQQQQQQQQQFVWDN
ncbi:expressed unknown protein [Seminavis robusta]|uniref:F-box domain-containing protein n=1 Tax=Seminavis robusta TaxID=568900 RepID=A0A9N8EV14_9STRA|nr:expressed unknown protein [Seminavis robusta]|eukprot:Sro1699_g292020.1 n/a (471) ;mRNA; f:8063-9475